MAKEKNMLIKGTMMYGFVMGLFWAFKYIFFILSVSYPFFSFVYWALTFAVPFLLAALIVHSHVHFQEKVSFMSDWGTGILIFFFAAVFVSLEHFVFYRYFAPENYISDSLLSAVELIKSMDMSEAINNMADALPTPSPIQMAIHGIFNNILYGVIVSLPVAAITRNIKIKIITNKD